MKHTADEKACFLCKLLRLQKEWNNMSAYNQVMLVSMGIEIGLLIIIVLQGWGLL